MAKRRRTVPLCPYLPLSLSLSLSPSLSPYRGNAHGEEEEDKGPQEAISERGPQRSFLGVIGPPEIISGASRSRFWG